MKKLIWIIILIAGGYFAYTFLLAPTRVTFSSYKKIQQGMSLSQVESKLSTGLIRALFRSMEMDQDKGEEILNEFAKDSRGGIKDILRQRAPAGTIKGTSVSNGGRSHFDQDGLLAANAKDEYVSKEGTWKSDKTFVPAKRAKIHTSTYRGAGGIQNVSSYGEYEFHEYMEEVTVSNKRYKLIRNGAIHFDPNPGGRFECWKGKDERIITVLLTGEKVSYWSYQGPAEEFPNTPSQPEEQPKVSQPQPEVKAQVPEPPVQKVAMKDEKPPLKVTVPAQDALKSPEPVKEPEQPKPEVAPQLPVKNELTVKIEGYQKKIEDAKTSLDTVKKQCVQAKTDYAAAVVQFDQAKRNFQKKVDEANAYKTKPPTNDYSLDKIKANMENNKKVYDDLNAKAEKLSTDIQTYNRFIVKLKADGITEPVSKPE